MRTCLRNVKFLAPQIAEVWSDGGCYGSKALIAPSPASKRVDADAIEAPELNLPFATDADTALAIKSISAEAHGLGVSVVFHAPDARGGIWALEGNLRRVNLVNAYGFLATQQRLAHGYEKVELRQLRRAEQSAIGDAQRCSRADLAARHA